MIPGEMVIEKVHGLQCTSISIGERFALIMAEHRARVLRFRRRAALNNQNLPLRWTRPTIQQIPQREIRLFQQSWQHPIKQRLGMPGLRRFGSDGNLPGLKRSNSFGSFNQFRNRIPWRQSNSSLRRAGSGTDLSQASWHGDGRYVRGRSVGPLRGKMRGRGRKQQQVGQLQQQTGRAASVPPRGTSRGRGRGRGGVIHSQQNRNRQTGGFQSVNRGPQTGRLQSGNNNQQNKLLPTKEELDAQLDEYMASSQYTLDKELEEYMLKGAMMECE